MSRDRGSGSIYKQPGCNTWMIKYSRNSRPVREKTGTSNRTEALQKLRHRLAEIAQGTYAGPKMERILVAELADDFLRDYRINGHKSLGHAEGRWRNHLAPFFSAVRVKDVTSVAIARYVDSRLHEGAQSPTINRELAALKRMFRLAYNATPPKVLRLPAFPHLQENNARTGFVEDGQYDQLVAGISKLWLRAIVELAQTSGWRKRELLNLQVRHLDLGARTVRLDHGTTKNRDGREITVTGTVHALLTECVAGKGPDDFVFTRSDGKRVRDFRKAWRKLCAGAGVPDLLFHDLRRTAARNLRRLGVDEGRIMRIGGWRTRSVFQRYDIVSQADIRDAVEKLERHQAERAQKSEIEFGHDSGMIGTESGAMGNNGENGKVN